jgi:DNA-binding CsgD family transcriptional regulator
MPPELHRLALHGPLLARVFAANAALMFALAAFVALTPSTFNRHLAVASGADVAAWTLACSALAIALIDVRIVRSLVLQPRSVRRRLREPGVELTARELEIVRLIADSYTSKEIAEMLSISPKTVEAHRGHILKKLGVRDRVALIRFAIRRGWIRP